MMTARRMTSALVLGCALVSAFAACETEDGGGCDSDSDCKGDRVCDDGECVSDSGSGAAGGGTGGSGGAYDCSACDEIGFDCDAGECTYPLLPECYDGAAFICVCNAPPDCTDQEVLDIYLACYNGRDPDGVIYCYGQQADCDAALDTCYP